ncbi:hypothetical protein KFK09_019882 [Dendrobium nobile]|uniref:Uncharacterized protein n=1 Tax=Dendrobium nobile TaxID=94219 RepID=A0A8T3ATH1_DENNO|nr:hypothetical protein KFK09_019882 [Dendrobium nobile]
MRKTGNFGDEPIPFSFHDKKEKKKGKSSNTLLENVQQLGYRYNTAIQLKNLKSQLSTESRSYSKH